MLDPLDCYSRDSTLFHLTTKHLRDFIDPNHLLIQIDERIDFQKFVEPLQAYHCRNTSRLCCALSAFSTLSFRHSASASSVLRIRFGNPSRCPHPNAAPTSPCRKTRLPPLRVSPGSASTCYPAASPRVRPTRDLTSLCFQWFSYSWTVFLLFWVLRPVLFRGRLHRLTYLHTL